MHRLCRIVRAGARKEFMQSVLSPSRFLLGLSIHLGGLGFVVKKVALIFPQTNSIFQPVSADRSSPRGCIGNCHGILLNLKNLYELGLILGLSCVQELEPRVELHRTSHGGR